MTVESEPGSQPYVTLGMAYREYVQTLKPGQRAAVETYIRKYVEFQGESHPVAALSGSHVESYAMSQIRPSDPNAPDRVLALKAWFQFLKKRDYTAANYGVNIRVPKASANGRSGSTPVTVHRQETPIEMTAEGLEALKRELAELEEQRPKLIQAIEVARSDGDLRENAPYHAAREALAFHQQRMSKLEDSIRRAVVVDRLDTGFATIGSTVRVTNLDDGREATYTLVSAREANAAERKISVESPVGKELLGRRKGDEVAVATPRGEIHFRVEDVIHQS